MVLSELSYNKRAIKMSFVTARRPEVAKAQHSLVLIGLRLIFFHYDIQKFVCNTTKEIRFHHVSN